jgi:hypothetical protein
MNNCRFLPLDGIRRECVSFWFTLNQSAPSHWQSRAIRRERSTIDHINGEMSL